MVNVSATGAVFSSVLTSASGTLASVPPAKQDRQAVINNIENIAFTFSFLHFMLHTLPLVPFQGLQGLLHHRAGNRSAQWLSAATLQEQQRLFRPPGLRGGEEEGGEGYGRRRGRGQTCLPSGEPLGTMACLRHGARTVTFIFHSSLFTLHSSLFTLHFLRFGLAFFAPPVPTLADPLRQKR